MTRRQKQIAAAAAVVLLIIVVLILRRHKPADEETATAVNVETAVAVVKPLTTRIAALGTVQARPGHSADISAPSATRVSAVFVAVGDQVRYGQALVQLDKSVATAQRHGAEVAVATATQAFNRTQKLLAEGIAPRKDVETAAADLAKAKAELEQAQRAEALSTLRSPISGVVTVLDAALSRPVDAGATIVAVVDPRSLEIVFHLSPSDAGRVTTGTKVELSSGQETEHTVIGIGTITGISAALDTVSRSVDVRATIAAPTRPLKVGESLNGAILLTSRTSAVVVPVDALVPESEATVVYVVDANHVAHATPVTVGTRTEMEAEILSGLHGGETVVTHGAYGVSDSAHLQIGAIPPAGSAR
jgi:RND family efflux transporter MFP subunit